MIEYVNYKPGDVVQHNFSHNEGPFGTEGALMQYVVVSRTFIGTMGLHTVLLVDSNGKFTEGAVGLMNEKTTLIHRAK